MTVQIASPIVIGALSAAIVELAVTLVLVWRYLRRVEDERDEVVERADLQGDALREALREIDRLWRRLRPGR